MSSGNYLENKWNKVLTNDMFTLNDYRNFKNLMFDVSFYTEKPPINLSIKNFVVNIN